MTISNYSNASSNLDCCINTTYIDELSRFCASTIRTDDTWSTGVTLNEDYIKEACRKIWEERHVPKLLDGPEVPKWTGFIEI